MFNTTETLISRKIKATVKKIRTELIKRCIKPLFGDCL